ncbi:phosphatidylinositol N-acetylglucosaminyltransferase, putative [Plasmodium gallinaceum]|uniref:Phosphatidylinositol N-acetylglucosaminyltransferase, putative n=1 Tax=Plasmodium gallinaceum TaxID=5849 RepID=A0A1J1GVS6_PLAGA|nr:phosphatidylinositol N-acetylglucosaminyltransferase, putative [Plasmodium gallinaceum]CRG96658.1 phosphatidylinositol N-acetylglucosaminyltransferase, putative [Plasmodium gallinaceum]
MDHTNNALPKEEIKKKKKWRKILYEDLGYDDNYVDNSFLSSLLTNFGIKYKYSYVCLRMLCVNHQLMLVLFFLLSYYYIDKNIITYKFVTLISSITIILKEILIYETHRSLNSSLKNILDTIIIIGIIWILSPVLITLTQTHSDDTVYLVSILLLLFHLMFHNYGFIYEKNENINIFDATSLSCVVIASVILGSRLSSILQVFSFLFLSSILFFYSPFIFQTIALKNICYYNYILFPILFLILSFSIRRISITFFYLNLIGHIFVLLIVPAFFIEKNTLKTKLEGPWDIAVSLQDSTGINKKIKLK